MANELDCAIPPLSPSLSLLEEAESSRSIDLNCSRYHRCVEMLSNEWKEFVSNQINGDMSCRRQSQNSHDEDVSFEKRQNWMCLSELRRMTMEQITVRDADFFFAELRRMLNGR